MKNLVKYILASLVIVLLVLNILYTYNKVQQLEAKIPMDSVSRIEYDLKDELLRHSIRATQEDIQAINEELDQLHQTNYKLN